VEEDILAELSEKDKKILFGDNYKEVLEKAQQEGSAKSASETLRVSQAEKCRNNKFTAGALMVVGAILTVSNFYSMSGSSVMLVSAFGIAIFLLGAVWYTHNWRTLQRLDAESAAGRTKFAA
jgi:hypothetical protein